MTPQAQLLVTGAVELAIGLTLSWCAYRIWKRHIASRAALEKSESQPLVKVQKHSDLLNEIARLIGEHTQSVEYFQRSIELANSQSVEKPPVAGGLSSQLRIMRDANERFGSCAQEKSAELSQAVDQNPAVFQPVSAKFSDHRQKTDSFDIILERVPLSETPLHVQQLTFASLRDVLETKQKLEQELSAAHKQIEQQAAKLRAAESDARIDALTRIPNRRAFEEHMEGVHNLFDRQGIAYSLVMLDLDNFKTVNDKFGHAGGDAVLQVTAKVLQAQLRLSDRAFRLGGEEFVLVLVATNLLQARIVAERARKRVEASIVHFEGKELRITTSAGVADAKRGLSVHEVLERADGALYKAKASGRNRIVLADSQGTGAEGAAHGTVAPETRS